MAVHDAAGALGMVENSQRVEVGLAAKQRQYLQGRRIATHGRLLVEQRAQIAAVLTQHHRATVRR
ncbi:hypothetical protein D3C77_751120 [compost metagenome]